MISSTNRIEILETLKYKVNIEAKQKRWRECTETLQNLYVHQCILIGFHHPEVADTLYHMGLAFNQIKKFNRALKCLKKALHLLLHYKVDISLALLCRKIGEIEAKTGNFKSAIFHLRCAYNVEYSTHAKELELTTRKLLSYKTLEYANKIKCNEKKQHSSFTGKMKYY